MCSRLPREVRDMIYAQIWDGNYLYDTYSGMKTHFQTPCYWSEVFSNDRPYLPHVVKREFVGLKATREIVEAWYTAMEGVPTHYHPRMVMRKANDIDFLFADPFGTHIEPVKFLRKLKIILNINQLALEDGGSIDVESRMKQFAPLLTIRKKKGFRMTVVLSQQKVILNLWPVVFSVFKPTLEAFEKEGGHVRICFNHHSPHASDYYLSPECTSMLKDIDPNDQKWKATFIKRFDDELEW
ncbi:hypothetical protein P153DRAFT_370296 [Dothidotthia symphoricarpi CBS 119687]|uniref:Uncharacterized protein n=1 Tax=Dothidotthia symphoricarpi CBS 119687 TaxID=1392245 RepID=A0A6A5ZZ06_9PLEO|nr:uncharacterized protein P153DRAFT_370296 [Dothidotthia symphoricarpi CBS 119687]KAF2124972.1 hypothetical protein P153DRAFT_370296 [Dothidotthia symphoricarpi CBS 119687]